MAGPVPAIHACATLSVMAGPVPAIHVFRCRRGAKTWMPGSRPGMTGWVVLAGPVPAIHVFRRQSPGMTVRGGLSRRSVNHHRPDRLSFVHQIESGVDLLERHRVGD